MTGRPDFTYYSPDALEEVLVKSEAACECCGRSPGELYRGPFYSVDEVEALCLECIADGTAAKKFDGSFNDIVVTFEGTVVDAEAAKAPAHVIDELLHRTPGYASWQGNRWAFHCGDGGLFRGTPSAKTVADASPASRRHFEAGHGSWDEMLQGWTPHSPLALYHFACRHCGIDLFLSDCD